MTPHRSGVAEAEPAVDVVVESPLWETLPDADAIVRRAVAAAAHGLQIPHRGHAALDVLLCDDATMATLNARWRGQERATNVLSFPAAPPIHLDTGSAPLGDIAIAYETVTREAAEQGKAVADHLTHLVVHGFLHLLGYDHQMDGEAERMERLERDILARIGVTDPYASRDAEI
jgi:probable rRNA maturation factor